LRYATPRAIFLTRAPWTLENALMTLTLKRKRKNLTAHHATEMESMYPLKGDKERQADKPFWNYPYLRRSLSKKKTTH
jgi:hypothetical protein